MKPRILHFSDINSFFEATGFEKRTDIADFFVFRFDELPKDGALKMPPYQKDFHQLSLILEAGNALADINTQTNSSLANTLYFLSPEHIFSWQRNQQTTGFVVYFKTAFLNFFSGQFQQAFSFFSLSQQNFLPLNSTVATELAADFDKLYKEFYTPNPYRQQILQSFLLSLLFKCKSLQEAQGTVAPPLSKKQALVLSFQNLVTNCYIKHKQVSDYAEQLHLSANALNQTVKEVLGSTAKAVISEKIVQEAKRQLKYSTQDISEVAYALGFDEPTHFIRFFKQHTNSTPKAYRQQSV